MAVSYNPRVVTDNLVVCYDLANTRKSTTAYTNTNFLQNGSFAGGLGVPNESGSNPTNEIVELANPGDSPYVLRQNGNNTEYQMNIDGGAQGSLSASTPYVMSGWYAKSSDYNGSDTMFHARAYSSSGSHVQVGTGIGTLLYSVTINNITWQYRYQSFTTPADYSDNFDWFLGYGTNNTTGYRYYTGLRVEEGTFPSLLDFARNGNEGKVYGATYDSGNSGRLSFDGVDDYVRLVDNIGNPQTFSIEFWCYPTELDIDANNNYRRIFLAIGVNENIVLIEQSGTISFRIPGGNTTNFQASGFSGINEWGCVCCTYDQSTRKIYFNGVFKGQTSEAGVTVDFGTPQIVDGVNQRFKGYIGNFKIYSKALSDQEVRQNFESLRGRYGI